MTQNLPFGAKEQPVVCFAAAGPIILPCPPDPAATVDWPANTEERKHFLGKGACCDNASDLTRQI